MLSEGIAFKVEERVLMSHTKKKIARDERALQLGLMYLACAIIDSVPV